MKAWESKNAKNAAKAGGVSLMALSLAACGGSSSDDAGPATVLKTVYDAAVAAKASAEADATAAATAKTAAEAAQAAAEADAATAATAQATAEAAQAVAVAAQAAAETAKATADAALAAQNTAIADAGFADLDALIAAYTAVVSPKTLVLTSPATDVLVGGSGNDVISGSGNAIDAADSIIDESSTDADVLNLTADANSFAAVGGVSTLSGGAMTIANIETINVTIQSLTDRVAIDTASITGNSVLNVTREDVIISGATLNSGTRIDLTNVDSANTPALNVLGTETATATLAFDGATADGATLNADAVTTTVTVTNGAATVNAAAASGTVTIDDEAGQTNATAVVVNAAAATTVNVGQTQAFDGNVGVNAAGATTVAVNTTVGVTTINAAAATSITVDDAAGGGSVSGATSSTADSTITVTDIDASGFTISTGTGSSTASEKQISLELDGTTAATDAVTISATGFVTLDTNNAGQAVEIVNLSGAAGEVTYDLADADVVTTITASGSNAVNVTGAIAAFEAATVTGVDELTIDTANAAATADFDSISVGKIIVTADLDADGGGEEVVTVDADTTIEFRTNQTATSIDADTATGSMTIVAGDVNGAASAVGTLTTGAIVTSQATSNAATTGTTGGTVTITANDANLTASGVTAWMQTIVITGDEDVNLSSGGATVASAGINASGSTGVITATILDTVASTLDTTSVTTGSGADSITVNGDDIITVNTGGGDDTIIVTDVAATSTLNGSEGADTFTMTEAATAYIAIGGAGNDTFNTGTNTGMQATIIGGEGTDDTLIVGNAALDLTAASANFAISGVEVFELDATNNTMTMTATQFANNNTVKLEGDSVTADLFVVEGLATANTIDATGVTVEATQGVGITYTGGAANDVITGGAADETIAFGSATNAGGGVDTLDGGTGTDTFDGALVTGVTETGSAASIGAVINLGATSVTGTTVFAETGAYISGSASSVGSGKVAYLFTADATTNSANMSTLSNFENVVGTTGADYIVGDAGANSIDGGTGADVVTGGSGADTFVFAAGDSGQTAALADVIKDYSTGADIIDVTGVTLTLVAEGSAAGAAQAAIAADGTVTFNAADDTIAEQIIAVEAGMTAATAVAGETAIWADPSSAANAYIFVSDGVAGVGANDLLILIEGDAAGAITLTGGDITAIA